MADHTFQGHYNIPYFVLQSTSPKAKWSVELKNVRQSLFVLSVFIKQVETSWKVSIDSLETPPSQDSTAVTK